MSLKERLTEDMKTAMRAKETARLSAIRLINAAIKQREVDERITLDDAAVVGVIEKMLKQRRDSIEAFDKAGRADLADAERAEAAVLNSYMPERLGAEAVAAAVAQVVAQVAAELGRAPAQADMGRVMAAAKATLAGKADMAQVSAAIKSALAQG
jgi:uncharacterized protein